MPIVLGAQRLEEFLAWAAGMSLDKNDLERVSEMCGRKLDDVLMMAAHNAQSEGRDVVNMIDLPITKGLQERLEAVRSFGEPLSLDSIDFLARSRQVGPGFGDDVVDFMPQLLGALLVGAAQVAKAVYPDVENPTTDEWNVVAKIMDILL